MENFITPFPVEFEKILQEKFKSNLTPYNVEFLKKANVGLYRSIMEAMIEANEKK